MEEVAILGVGMHPWGKWPERSFIDFGLVAANNALKDARLEWKDIQFVAAGQTIYSGGMGLLAASNLAQEMGWTGIPVMSTFNACATGAYAMDAARARILAGSCDIALCIGMDIAPKGFFGPTGGKESKDLDTLRFKLLGATNPNFFAMYAMRRMHNYGTTELDIAKVKVKNSHNGCQNPYARYKKAYELEEVLFSPMVAYPLRLLNLCATSDGAAAVVLASMKVARRYTSNPIKVAAISTVSPQYPDTILPLVRFSSDSAYSTPNPPPNIHELVGRKAYEEAGLGPEDIHVAEVYDITGAYELDWYEFLGLCRPGEAERLLNDGDTTLEGRLPVNPSGGLSSFGEAVPAQAIAQVCELVWQIRGEAGARQAKNAKVGITANVGAQGNASSVIVKR
jgi:acetyl-CoA acetyltransferase